MDIKLLKQIAEAVADADWSWDSGGIPDCWTPIVGTLLAGAKLYLAEHPADDDAIADEHWLLSISKVKDDGVLTIQAEPECSNTVFRWLEIWIGGIEWLWAYCRLGQDCDRVNVPTPRTRGDVRRLARALGIELKEASDGET